MNQQDSRRQYGRIRMWNDERGFGFVVPENGNVASYFLHASQIPEDQRTQIQVGVFVEFTPLKKDKGWTAVNVSVAK
jgi:cold shock CspA family protein